MVLEVLTGELRVLHECSLPSCGHSEEVKHSTLHL